MEVERALMRVNEGLESFGPDSLIHSKPSGLVQKQPRKLLMTEPSKKRKLGMKIRAGKGLVQPGSKTQFLSKPIKLHSKGVKLQAGKGLFQPSKPNVNRISKPDYDPSHATHSGSNVGCGGPCPSALVGDPPETSTAVEVCFPSIQIPSSSRGSDMAIVGLVNGGNLSKGSPIGMDHPGNLPVG